MIKSKQLFMALACLLAVRPAASAEGPGGIRPYQDLVNVSPGLKGAGTSVNVADGLLVHVREDLYVPGRGLPLRVVFTYIGSGWQMNYRLRYVADPGGSGDCYLNRPNGNIDHFAKQPDGSYKPTSGVRDELAALDTGYKLIVWRDGMNNRGDYAVYYYDDPNHTGATRIEDRNGNALTFAYDPSHNLQTVTDTAGRKLTFTYTNGKLTRILDPADGLWQYQYDADGNMVQVTDPAGGTTRYEYASDGGLCTQITDARGSTWQFTYVGDRVSAVTDPLGRAAFAFTYETADASDTRVADGNGNSTKYRFDQEGRVTAVENALGHVTAREWDDHYNLVSVTDGNGRTTTSTYDTRGNLLTRTDPLGHTIQYTWEHTYNNKTSYTDANGVTTAYAHDAKGNLISRTDALGGKTTYAYDASGQMASATNALGHTTHHEYDASGHLTKTIDALGGQTSFTYDEVGNLLSKTNANGHTTRCEYDILGRLTKRINALGGTATFTYDAVGNTVSQTDAKGNTTSYAFDAVNRLITRTDALGGSTAYTYDVAGNRLTQTDSNGNSTSFTYDKLNRTIVLTDALGAETRYAYDAGGNVISKTDAAGNRVTYTYDAADRISSRVSALGGTKTWTYDAAGNRLSSTDENGNTTRYGYDRLNRLVSVTDALGGVTAYAYDALGNLTSETNPNGHTTRYEYDALGRQVKTTTPLGNTWQYAHDAVGNVAKRTDANGSVTSYAYDALNRRTQTTYANGRVDWSYDPVGRLIGIRNGLGLQDETTYEYDALGRVTSCTIGYGTAMDAQTVAYVYDAAGRRVKTTYPLGQVLEYAYDEAGRLVQVDGFDGVTSYTYDEAGRRTSMTYPNSMSVAYEYDANNRITRLTVKAPDGGVLVEETCAYDAAGNKTYQSRDADDTDRQIQYDALNRIASVTYHLPAAEVRTYTYDAAGQRLTETVDGATTTFTYNADGRVIQQAGPDDAITYSYDNNGNRISKVDQDGVTTYTFDDENRLAAISLPDEWLQRLEYAYCPQGLRLMKRADEYPTYYGYDGADIISEQGPDWEPGQMWRILHNPRITAMEGKMRVYPIYGGAGTTVAEGSGTGQSVHLVDFDEFGVKIKGSFEPLTQYGGDIFDLNAGCFWSGYDAQTASNITSSQTNTGQTPSASSTSPQVWTQTGVGTWVSQDTESTPVTQSMPPAPEATTPAASSPTMTEADLIRLRDEINQRISVGFTLSGDVQDSFWHAGTMSMAEERAVEGGWTPLASGTRYAVYAVDPQLLVQLAAERQIGGLTGPVTSATRYSVVITGDAGTVTAQIRNNLTGRWDTVATISTQGLRQGEPQAASDSVNVQRILESNQVWESFATGISNGLRNVLERDQAEQ